MKIHEGIWATTIGLQLPCDDIERVGWEVNSRLFVVIISLKKIIKECLTG